MRGKPRPLGRGLPRTGSNTLDAGFCIEALEEALKNGKPEIFNTDQGVQFTSLAFTGILERVWRSLKYEDIYLKSYESLKMAREGIGRYFRFHNNERLLQSLDSHCPSDVYFKRTVHLCS